jgi:hypothetical protein
MQKISNYLYPNRIELTTDLAVHSTEYRTVYQRRFKVYKGFRNDLLLDIKNNEQKRINVSDKTIKFSVLDQHNQEIYLTTAIHSSTPGLATVSIPASAFEQLKPQFLKFSVYIQNNDSSRSPLYGDTQFGLGGHLDLIEDSVPVAQKELIIDTFNYLYDDSVSPAVKRYYSEAALVNPLNDLVSNPNVILDFYFNNFEGTITVQFTQDSVIHNETVWTTAETFNVANTTTTLTKNYGNPYYSTRTIYARVQYVLAPLTNGKIDKINLRR